MNDNDLSQYYKDIIEGNFRFLRSGDGESILNAALELANAVSEKFRDHVRSPKDYMEEPEGLYLTLFHSPYSYGLIKDLFTGDLSGCYCKLRIMLEGLAYCCEIKSRGKPEPGMNYEKLLHYVESKRQSRDSTTKVMKKLDNNFHLKGCASFAHLWRETSNDYLHPAGPVRRFVSSMDDRGTIPVGALILPAQYVSADLGDLQTLGLYLSAFRRLLDVVMP
ncbi:MAG: hypothetical protein B7X04_01565 [Parcubacteria group bacterium 21-54-25]|nr:MAG: hypothetical protein B7X04_01565 [Parcubacteria group bacterium 21-54-25]HQU07612.1 hypothetical protein [Candidatus Paceibacterota bacterium]